MSQKGNLNIVVDPDVLLPAVTHTKLKYSDLSSRLVTLKTTTQKILEDGVLSGPRMAQEKALAETIQKTCDEMLEVLNAIGGTTEAILSTYISIEGQANVARIVAQATESVKAKGDKQAIQSAGGVSK